MGKLGWLNISKEKNYIPQLIDASLEVPLKSDGRGFELDDLLEDQRQIMTVILCKLRKWLSHLDIEDKCEMGDFKPLRMTIMGAVGTGKSVLINTLVTVLRVMFNDNDVVHVAAPTGTAAFNVAGETLHRMFSIMVEDNMKNLKGMSE
jgi:predicted GTPase